MSEIARNYHVNTTFIKSVLINGKWKGIEPAHYAGNPLTFHNLE